MLHGLSLTAAAVVMSGFVLQCLAGHHKAATIEGYLHGINHYFQTRGLTLPFHQPQVRLLLRGIERLDAPPAQKAAATPGLLRAYCQSLNLHDPQDQALWGFLCLAFFFLLRRSDIVGDGSRFKWFALRAKDISVINGHGLQFLTSDEAVQVTISLKGSKANQHRPAEVRHLSKSGHKYLCPVIGAIALLRARGEADLSWPAAIFSYGGDSITALKSLKCSGMVRLPSASNPPGTAAIHSAQAARPRCTRVALQATTVQYHGRWASYVFKRYIQQDAATSNLIAKLMVGECGAHHDGSSRTRNQIP